jgi:hypothetical protein
LRTALARITSAVLTQVNGAEPAFQFDEFSLLVTVAANETIAVPLAEGIRLNAYQARCVLGDDCGFWRHSISALGTAAP